MKREYNIIIENLNNKLNTANIPDFIKFLYHKKIMLLKEEIMLSESTLKETQVEAHIKNLDNEINNLIISSKHGMSAINSFISNKLIKANNLNKSNHQKSNIIKRKLITYLLTLSVILTANAYTIDRVKNKTREVLFNTEIYTFNDDNNTINRTEEFLPQTNYETLSIKRITPWIVEGNQGKRIIYTYKITNMSLDEILASRDYEKIVSNLDCTSTYEYKYKNELRDYDKYEEPIYKVIYQTQDYHDYRIEYHNLNSKLLALLLCNILIYLLMININNGPLLESLLYDIKTLQQSDKQLDIDYEIITSYRKKISNNK